MPGPIAPKGTNCPLWKKDVSKVCHTCEWYEPIFGTHPQTGERIDKWMCAMKALIITTIDAGKQAGATADAVQHLRNDQLAERSTGARVLFELGHEVNRQISRNHDTPKLIGTVSEE